MKQKRHNRPQNSHKNKAFRPKSASNVKKDLTGIVSISSKGVGYVAENATDPRERNIIIEPTFLRTALHGDKVKVQLHTKTFRKQRTGEITEIIQRKKSVFAGTCAISHGVCTLVPKDRKMYTDIIIPEKFRKGAEDGDKILVELDEWSDDHKTPMGRVLQVYGKTGENNAEMSAIAGEWGFELNFPESVMDNIAEILAKKEYQNEIEKREDFKNVTTFTIDPYDAKDFDDALSIKDLGGDLYEIGVHIADVSYFVKPGTALDDEALKRATSVYLVDRTVPMLPLELSTDLCSLNENVPRLAMSGIFTIDKNGFVKSRRFAETVIHSNKRFTYEDAQKVLDDGQGLFHDELKTLMDISKKMRTKRQNDGALMLEGEEVKFVLDENNFPVGVKIKVHQDTNEMIEEYMLLANEEVTKWVEEKIESGITDAFLYRVHPHPESVKIEKLENFLSGLGYTIKRDRDGLIPSKNLNAIVAGEKSHPVKDALTTMITRSMAKAYYTTHNIGHYGLAKEFYTHFTSPIRRYPDLLVHRIVRALQYNQSQIDKVSENLESMCEHASSREKDAQQAERESIKYKQVEYMSVRIGQIFDGAVTGITEWGIYVEEETTLSEGLIRIGNLSQKELYIFDEKHICLIGQKTKTKIKIGDKVKIKVENADINRSNIDYSLV